MYITQNDQWGKLKEANNSPNSASHEAEESRKQREVPVHWLKEVVEEKRISDIQNCYNIANESQSK
jgi:hypothetical protein